MDKIWNRISLLKRTIIVAAFALCLTMIAGAMHKASQPQLTNLINADERIIAEVKNYLEQNNVEHTVTSTTQILINERIKAKTLLDLARAGIIGNDTGKNHELFDEFSFGMTDELFGLNKKRLLENKLAQIIMDGHLNISKAFVNLNIHDTKPTDSSHKEPTAIVKIVNDGHVNQHDVTGIQNIIASSVMGLKPSHIVVSDRSNQLLSEHKKEIDTTILLDEEEEILFKRQRHLQTRLQQMIQNHCENIQSVYVILNLSPINPSSSIKVISHNPLTSDEVIGIETLVANAVVQLNKERIVILDNNNRVLNQDINEITN